MQGAPKNIRWGLPRRWTRELRTGYRSLRTRITQHLHIHRNKRIGRWGENVARRHLIRSGLSIIDTNWRAGGCEADIIAQDGRTLLIVEVKTRHTSLTRNFPALSAVTHQKRKTLHWLGRSFIRNKGPVCRRRGIKTLRTDAIEVYYTPGIFGRLRLSAIRWHRGLAESNRDSPFDRYEQRTPP